MTHARTRNFARIRLHNGVRSPSKRERRRERERAINVISICCGIVSISKYTRSNSHESLAFLVHMPRERDIFSQASSARKRNFSSSYFVGVTFRLFFFSRFWYVIDEVTESCYVHLLANYFGRFPESVSVRRAKIPLSVVTHTTNSYHHHYHQPVTK